MTPENTAATPAAVPRARKSKSRKAPAKGYAYVRASFNNTIVTITDQQGSTLVWASAGSAGYKGSRKSTPYAAQHAAQRAAESAYKLGMRELDVRVNGPGAGRESAVRGLHQGGLKVNSIEDITPLPHNGCRPPKRRRV
ncbi:MAG: 30S ribosomal protein S11 [Planctomycetota bacterium]|nr:MAG: 30S ribosomal protein S11 [Planctomycetota bacterium]